MAVVGEPIFYLRVGRRNSARHLRVAVNLLNSTKLSSDDEFYYLQCGRPNWFMSRSRIFANGSRVGAESGGGAVPPTTRPSALAAKLSRRASHHGAVFAVRVQSWKGDELSSLFRSPIDR